MSDENNSNGGIDWRAESQFWQTKYLEQMVHYNQVIANLSRTPLLEMALREIASHQPEPAPAPSVEEDTPEQPVSPS